MSSPFWMYAASKVTEPSLDNATYRTWYQNFHIPDILRTGSVQRGTLYQTLDPDGVYQWLATYDCQDFDFMRPEKFRMIPNGHALLGKDKASTDVAQFDVRRFELLYASEGILPPNVHIQHGCPTQSAILTLAFTSNQDDEEIIRSCAEKPSKDLATVPGFKSIKIFRLLYSNRPAATHMALLEQEYGDQFWSEPFQEGLHAIVAKLRLPGDTIEDIFTWQSLGCHEAE